MERRHRYGLKEVTTQTDVSDILHGCYCLEIGFEDGRARLKSDDAAG